MTEQQKQARIEYLASMLAKYRHRWGVHGAYGEPSARMQRWATEYDALVGRTGAAGDVLA